MIKFIRAAVMLPFLIGTLCAQTTEKCATGILFNNLKQSNPKVIENYLDAEKDKQSFIKNNIGKSNGSLRIIPTVFHVIHEGGDENISKAQILDQLNILNNDIRRMNADTVNTPAPFKPLGADCEIEFRLAQLDPNGNCTDGIVRVFSNLTNSAGDNVKALSFWDSDKYMNVWVVRNIYNWTGGPGFILGYAYFPGTAPPGADGIVIRADYVGSIGTAAPINVGRTLAHEVGHYLDLAHVWGDSPCGSDGVLDTPTSQGPNYGCVAFPHISCSNGPNGDMFSNYMDYADDGCMNIFTWGQKARMDNTLNGFRSQLISQSNLLSTGTDGTPAVPCVLIPDFYPDYYTRCSGLNVTFNDATWNSDATAWSWDFPGGNPSSSFQQNPVVQYAVPGLYDVTLTVTNATGTYTIAKPGLIKIYPALASLVAPFMEDFESVSLPSSDWEVENNGGAAWQLSTDASVSGTTSVKLDNFSGNVAGTQDVFITPAYDFSNIGNVTMTFKQASAGTVSAGADNLKVYASTNCGQTWTLRYFKTGNAFYSAGIQGGNFIPQPADWRTETLNLTTATFAGQPNVKFKFVYTYDSGNNVFIDDINITGTPLGMDELNSNEVSIDLYPNPATSEFVVRGTKKIEEINIADVVGRELLFSNIEIRKGENKIVFGNSSSNGIYFIRIKTCDGIVSKKMTIVN